MTQLPSPRLPDPPPTYDVAYFRRLIRAIEQGRLTQDQPVSDGWVVTNGVERRTLDVSTATLAETKEFLGTLMQDLINSGRFKE